MLDATSLKTQGMLTYYVLKPLAKTQTTRMRRINGFVILTFRLLMSYIYGAPILDVSRSHTTTQHSR